MSFSHRESASYNNAEYSPLKLTISVMKFMPSKQPRPAIQSHRVIHHHQSYLHSASHHHLHRAISFKNDKEKRIRRLQEQTDAFRPQQHMMEAGQSQMLKTWNSPFISAQHKNPQIQTLLYHQIDPMPSQLSERLPSRKKLPTIKYDIDLKKRKNESARRDLKPSPAQLLTRKLQWQGRTKKADNPQKLTRPKPKTSHPTSIPSLKQKYTKKQVFLKLSGWQPQHSQQYATSEFYC